ncbi:trimethylamine methyltransferase family protein [Candidatus Bipolaricaulota bacterium]|nr:trimethylamine methyltransferase family protein [Candidatus Bipolaricaulota bacterium]
MLSSQKLVNKAPKVDVLSEDDRKEIYSAALEILQRTGVRFGHEEALSILSEAGATVDGNVVFIPQNLVEEGLNKAPATVTIYDRLGNTAMRLGGRRNYFGTGPDAPKVLTLDGDHRKIRREDVEKVATVVDGLDNLDFVMSLGLIRDEPFEVTDLYQFQEMLFNTTKPVVFTSQDKRGNKDIFEMAEIAVGGRKELRQRPFLIHYVEPTAPLDHPKEAIEKLIYQAEERMPVIYTPASSAGATGPMSFAGIIALSVAESLSGITLAQIINPGTPVITGGAVSLLDMNNSSFLYGAPETSLMHVALSEMSQFLDLPMYGTAGCSDSKVPDNQAALEATFSIATQSLSGANLIHDVGCLASGMTASLEQIVMSNEIIGMVKRIMRGVKTSELEGVSDLIDKVGPQGNFLSQKDTVDKFKKEIWQPELIDRKNFDEWKDSGAKTMEDRVNELAREVLQTHEPQRLDEDKREEIEHLIDHERNNRQVDY